MCNLGCPWVLTYEWNRSAGEDLLQDEVRNKVVKMMHLGCFRTMGAAPICSSFSVAVTPPVRSRRHPRGLPRVRASMRIKIKQGNMHNDFVKDFVELCEMLGIFYFIENPDTSWWWRQSRWKRWREIAPALKYSGCVSAGLAVRGRSRPVLPRTLAWLVTRCGAAARSSTCS